uniref:Secreted protein n=1 Tax=Plectus sambesii TaxID=2011161 RepID=A0A914W896_9BILA
MASTRRCSSLLFLLQIILIAFCLTTATSVPDQALTAALAPRGGSLTSGRGGFRPGFLSWPKTLLDSAVFFQRKKREASRARRLTQLS